MARRSRKQNRMANVSLEASLMLSEVKSLAGIYVRLSVEDNGYTHGTSLQNQILFLKDYLERHSDEIQLVDIYEDNGLTGTNFERKGWERLIEDLKRRKINCIVVKDFSRIGRNYIEVGNYLEKIFPFLGVRVIAVNECYDSAKESMQRNMLINSLSNIVNEYYARDISKKVRQVKRVMQERGEYISVTVPYGYQRSEDNRKKLCIDNESACVVKQIFAWRMQGKGCTTIANYLNELAIPSPGMYYYMNGNPGYKKCSQSKWKSKHVAKILTDLTYLGHTVQGKIRRCCFEQNGKNQYLPKDDWIIVKNTHEPLISQEDFTVAEKMAKQSKERHMERMKMYDDVPYVDNPLRKKIFCGQCGRLLTRRSRVKKGIRKYSYFCSFSKQTLDVQCRQTEYPEYILMDRIIELTKREMEQNRGLAAVGKNEVQYSKENGHEEKGNNNETLHIKKQYLENQLIMIERKKQEIYAELKEEKVSLEEYWEEKRNLIERQYEHEKELEGIVYRMKSSSSRKVSVFTSISKSVGETDGEEVEVGNDIKDIQYIEDKDWFDMDIQETEEIPFSVLVKLIDKVLVFSREKIEIIYAYQDGSE